MASSAILCSLLLSGSALAAEVPENLRVSAADSAATGGTAAPIGQSTTTRHRDNLMELNFRGRYLSVPSSVLDIWYFDSDDEGANIPDRPKARGYALGIEYVLKPRPINWFFYYEYIGNLMKPGYWDDVEEPAQHEDGDWIEPEGFGMHVLGANFGHEVDITPSDNEVWLSLIFGAGLGIGFVSGDLTMWHPGGNESNTDLDCLPQSAAFDRVDSCPNDGAKRVPGVLPMIDLSGAARLNFGERATVRLDFGIHDMLYIGGAAGGVF